MCSSVADGINTTLTMVVYAALWKPPIPASLFARRTAAVVAEVGRLSDHAVAGDDEGDRVLADGVADSAHGLGEADVKRHVLVGTTVPTGMRSKASQTLIWKLVPLTRTGRGLSCSTWPGYRCARPRPWLRRGPRGCGRSSRQL